ncbi:hypothetical protein FRC07_002343 [Ceratobasidium sp. 392]|nr:hypothetical protein FRC07_002343 [Ceratobasidium sp. 392]
MTVIELDRIAAALRTYLNASNLTLAQVLESATWKGGREIAKQNRPETGGPPIEIESDGTVRAFSLLTPARYGRQMNLFTNLLQLVAATRDAFIQAPSPSQSQADAQWIHTSDLANAKSSAPARSRVIAIAEAAPIPPPPPPPQPAATRPSMVAKFAGWISKKFPFSSRTRTPLSDAPPRHRFSRGAKQSAVVAAPPPVFQSSPPEHADPLSHSGPQDTSRPPDRSSAPNRSSPLTEVAIVTPDGLKTYIHDPEGRLSPDYRTDRICSSADAMDLDWVDLGDTPSPSVNQATKRYENIERDISMVVDHLRERQFREMRAVSTPSEQASLREEVATYLGRLSDSDQARQVRILIFTGHNSLDSTALVISPQVKYPWGGLRKSLQGVPPRVTVVVVLACCHAKSVLEDVMDEEIPEVVGMAACERFETAGANTLKGDYFLDALFEVLQHEGGQNNFEKWEDFLGPVTKELRYTTKTQNPVVYVKTTRTPSDVFHALTHPPAPAQPRGRTPPIAQSR